MNEELHILTIGDYILGHGEIAAVCANGDGECVYLVKDDLTGQVAHMRHEDVEKILARVKHD